MGGKTAHFFDTSTLANSIAKPSIPLVIEI